MQEQVELGHRPVPVSVTASGASAVTSAFPPLSAAFAPWSMSQLSSISRSTAVTPAMASAVLIARPAGGRGTPATTGPGGPVRRCGSRASGSLTRTTTRPMDTLTTRAIDLGAAAFCGCAGGSGLAGEDPEDERLDSQRRRRRRVRCWGAARRHRAIVGSAGAGGPMPVGVSAPGPRGPGVPRSDRQRRRWGRKRPEGGVARDLSGRLDQRRLSGRSWSTASERCGGRHVRRRRRDDHGRRPVPLGGAWRARAAAAPGLGLEAPGGPRYRAAAVQAARGEAR